MPSEKHSAMRLTLTESGAKKQAAAALDGPLSGPDPTQRSTPLRQRGDSQQARYQFSIGSALMVLFVVSAMGASAHYLVRAVNGSRTDQLVFVLFTLASPPLLAVLAALSLGIARWWNRRI